MPRPIGSFKRPGFSPILRYTNNRLLDSIDLSYIRHQKICRTYCEQTHFQSHAAPRPFARIQSREGIDQYFADSVLYRRVAAEVRLEWALLGV
jgi:hypothetical protein